MEAGNKKTTYIEAVGRRKTAIARVRIRVDAKPSVTVNGKDSGAYFKTTEQRRVATEAIAKAKAMHRFRITARIGGGGLSAQAEALRHAMARALIAHDLQLRKKLKKAGFLKRDPRAKERRKFGLKKARKSPQWSKR